MKDIKKMALELHNEAINQGISIQSIEFSYVGVGYSLDKTWEVNVSINATLCDKQEKAPG